MANNTFSEIVDQLKLNNNLIIENNTALELSAYEISSINQNLENVTNENNLKDIAAGIDLIAMEFPNISKQLSDAAAGIDLIAMEFPSFFKNKDSQEMSENSPKNTNFENYENLIKSISSIKFKDLIIAKFALKSYVNTILESINELGKIKAPDIDNSPAFKIFETFSLSLKNFSGLDKKTIKLIPKALDNLTNGIISSFEKLKDIGKINDDVNDNFKSITESFELFKDLDFKKILIIKLALPQFAKSVVSAFSILNLIKNPKTVEKITESLGKSINNLIEPLKSSVDVLKTASTSLVKFGFASLLFAGSLLAFNFVKPESVTLFASSLAALAAASFAIQKSGGTKGALAIAALGASLLPLAFSLKLLSDIKWETLAIAGTALVGLAAAAFGLSFIAPAIFVGSLAIAALGASLLPLALSLNLLSTIDSKMLTSLGDSLLTLVTSILPILPFAPLFGLFSLSLIPLSVGLFVLSKIGNKLNGVTDFFDRFGVFSKSLEPSKIFSFSTALGTLSAAMVAFGAANVVTGISNLVTKFLSFGGDSPIDQIIKLADRANDLSIAANSIFKLAEAMGAIANLGPDAFAGFNSFSWDKIEDIADELGDNSIIQIVPSVATMPSSMLNEVGSSLNGGGQVINVVNAPNNGGNISTTNMSNQTTNLKTGPRIISGSAMDL
jgi:hypothetical protein